MITSAQLQNATQAITKAEELNPTVTCYQLGDYMVAGSKADYQVKIELHDDGVCRIACACRATDFGKACYHAAAAAKTYSEVADHERYSNERWAYEERKYFS